MKSILKGVSVLALLFFLAFNVSAKDKRVVILKVAADAVPHAEILEFVKPILAQEGIDLRIFVTNDWTNINEQTNEGIYDANYFQHLPFLQSNLKNKKLNLISLGAVHLEPIALYSHKYRRISELPENATIAVPSDPSNRYRALLLLEKNGFLVLREGIVGYQASKGDIEKFLKPIRLVEFDASRIAQSAEQFDAYVTSTNRILEFNIDDSFLAVESAKNSPYANLLVIKKSRSNDAALKKLIEVLQSPNVKRFIYTKYNGFVLTAF